MEGTPADSRGESFIHGRAFKALIIILVIVAILWVASELAVPRIASWIATNEIESRYPEAQDVSVTIKAFPVLKIAFKKYDELIVEVGQVTLQGVKFDRIELESTQWPLGGFEALLGQDEVSRFFSLKNSYVIDPVITLTEGGIAVTGKIDVASARVAVTATGQVEPVEGRQVFFRPSDIQVAGIPVPAEGVAQVRQVMELNPVFIVREDLPYTITGTSVENGRLVITGTVDLEKALNVTL